MQPPVGVAHQEPKQTTDPSSWRPRAGGQPKAEGQLWMLWVPAVGTQPASGEGTAAAQPGLESRGWAEAMWPEGDQRRKGLELPAQAQEGEARLQEQVRAPPQCPQTPFLPQDQVFRAPGLDVGLGLPGGFWEQIDPAGSLPGPDQRNRGQTGAWGGPERRAQRHGVGPARGETLQPLEALGPGPCARSAGQTVLQRCCVKLFQEVETFLAKPLLLS